LGVCDETRQGALRFYVKEGEYPAPGGRRVIPPLIKLANLLSAVEKILDNTESAKDLQLLLAPGSHSTIESALQNINALNLTEPQAKEIISEVKKAVSGWRKTAKSLGIIDKNINKMKPAFIEK